MTLLLGFAAPLLAYAWMWRRHSRRAAGEPSRGVAAALPLLLLVAAAGVSTSVAARLLLQSGSWPEQTEIAWTGVRMKDPAAPLVVGGAAETSAIGWPTGARWPELRAESSSAGAARVVLTGGGAVVRHGGRAINGVPVALGGSERIGGVDVAVTCRWPWLPCSQQLRLGLGASAIAATGVSGLGASTFEGRVQEEVARLRSSGQEDAIKTASALETWSVNAVVAAEDAAGKVVRVVWNDPAAPPVPSAATELSLPAVLEVRWPGRVLDVRLNQDPDGALRMEFLPPWRRRSPLPDRPTEGDQNLVLTDDPRPGDFAFEVPFGRSIPIVRTDLRLGKRDGHTVFIDGAHRSALEGLAVLPGNKAPAVSDRAAPAARTSLILAAAGPMLLELSTVQDLLDPPVLSASLLFSFVLMIGFVTWGARTADASNWWPLGMVSAAVWNLLVLRFLLAARYALDPRALDDVTIRGLAVAAIALTVVVPLLWTSVRFYRHAYRLPGLRRDSMKKARLAAGANLLFLVGLALAAMGQWRLITQLWPNLAPRQMPSPTSIMIALGFIFLLFAVHAAAMWSGLRRVDEVPRTALLLWPQRIILGAGQLVWEAVMRRPYRKYAYFLTCLVVFLGVAVALAVAHLFINPVKFVQDFVAPLLLVGIPVLFWLALLATRTWRTRPDVAPSWWILVMLGVPFVFLPIFSALFVLDPGGVFATLALIVPLGCLAAVLPFRRAGIVVLGYATLAVMAGSLTFYEMPRLPGVVVGALQRGASRYLVFTLGDRAQTLLPFAQLHSEVGDGIPVQSLQNSISHIWENRAIARSAGLLGWNFGDAPAHQAMVPQHVLQYDSTFSFFVVGDHGLIGGAAVILLYAVPLMAVLASARRRFDLGHALAALIAASLLNEALVHTAMNLGGLPFTGRNLPLLSVNSVTDLLRWLVSIVLLAQCLVWRTTSQDSVLSPSVGGSLFRTVLKGDDSGRPYRFAVFALLAPTVFLAVSTVAVPAWRVSQDSSLSGAFTWGEYHRALTTVIESGGIGWDSQTRQIRFGALPIQREGRTVLEQEVVRFNALPEHEKIGTGPVFGANLDGIRSLPSYDALMDRLRVASARPSPGRPPLFQVVRDTVADPATGEETAVERLIVNPNIDVSLRFVGDMRASDVPTLSFRSRAGQAAGKVVIGPAWVNGRWRAVRNTAADLPWLQRFGDIVMRRSRRVAGQGPDVLTVDEVLQRDAQNFVSRKGRERHGALLAPRAPGVTQPGVLPPRVALSVVDLPTGRVLALGGWPRTSASNRWEVVEGELLPPAAWLQSAPAAMARRYAGDRNFDRIEMGSASKPLWAFAALLVHPQLRQQLATRGSGGAESAVFGIPVRGAGWHVTAGGWTRFDQYLSASDNRYQVRLGFLGLADTPGGNVKAGGPSMSRGESMDGGKSEWRKTPAFPSAIGFSSEHAARLENLDKTAYAQAFRDMFGVGVAKGQVQPYRLSFWTGDERDNLPDSGRWDDALAALSPEATQLRLDAVSTPREYVSLLLGGLDNRWSNVEFAAEFGTAVTGHPVIAHMADDVELVPASTRRSEPSVAAAVRPGLAGTAVSGTAANGLQSTGALSALTSIRGARVYAKTGTLALQKGQPETSRLVVAVVRWDNEANGTVKAGLVFSLVVERGYAGLASRWLGEFIAQEASSIRYFLGR